ncbi:hypothetical protein [Streptomyces hydrogenans]
MQPHRLPGLTVGAIALRRDVPVPRDYRRGRGFPDAAPLAILIGRLVDYKASVHACGEAETPATLAGILTALGAGRVGIVDVCVGGLLQVTAGVLEALKRLVSQRPTPLVSGPSATSDIELERVKGVHGPRTRVVVIRTDRVRAGVRDPACRHGGTERP